MSMQFEDQISYIKNETLIRLRKENEELKEAQRLSAENRKLREQVGSEYVNDRKKGDEP